MYFISQLFLIVYFLFFLNMHCFFTTALSTVSTYVKNICVLLKYIASVASFMLWQLKNKSLSGSIKLGSKGCVWDFMLQDETLNNLPKQDKSLKYYVDTNFDEKHAVGRYISWFKFCFNLILGNSIQLCLASTLFHYNVAFNAF